MKKYKAVVIGAGSIGADKPDQFDSPKTKAILTHAHAYYKHPEIDLVGIVDVDSKRAKRMAKKWNTISYDHAFSIPEFIDIVSVCTPDHIHWSAVYNAVNVLKAKVVIIEKPAGENEAICESIYNDDIKIPKIVNYTRRFEPFYQGLKEQIKNKELGEIFSCTIHYDRGIIRDGSHAIDLCNFLFGRWNYLEVLKKGLKINDYKKEDPSIPVFLSYEKCKSVFLIPSDGRAYSMFEVDIMTEKGRYIFRNHGTQLDFYEVEKEKTYGNYNALSIKPRILRTDLTYCLSYLVDNAIDVLEKKAKPICTMQDALRVHRIIDSIFEQL